MLNEALTVHGFVLMRIFFSRQSDDLQMQNFHFLTCPGDGTCYGRRDSGGATVDVFVLHKGSGVWVELYPAGDSFRPLGILFLFRTPGALRLVARTAPPAGRRSADYFTIQCSKRMLRVP